jgi:hypothetical protein
MVTLHITLMTSICVPKENIVARETTHIHVEQPCISHNFMDNGDKKNL